MEVQNVIIENNSKHKRHDSSTNLKRISSGKLPIIVGAAKTHTISHMTPISVISA